MSQAEAVLDIIHAKTSNFAQKSANNLSGALAQQIKQIKDSLFTLYSRIIAAVDFPEDVKEPEYSYLIEECQKNISNIERILKNANASNIMRQGIKIAIAGCPMQGNLLCPNALLNIERAIDANPLGQPETLFKNLLIDGSLATLIDTAGIRDKRRGRQGRGYWY